MRNYTCPVCEGSGEYADTTERSRVTGEYVTLHDCGHCGATGRVDAIEAWIFEQDRLADQQYKYEREERAA